MEATLNPKAYEKLVHLNECRRMIASKTRKLIEHIKNNGNIPTDAIAELTALFWAEDESKEELTETIAATTTEALITEANGEYSRLDIEWKTKHAQLRLALHRGDQLSALMLENQVQNLALAMDRLRWNDIRKED